MDNEAHDANPHSPGSPRRAHRAGNVVLLLPLRTYPIACQAVGRSQTAFLGTALRNNLNVTPIPSSPRIPTFYPGVRHRRDAVPIFVPDAATHLRYDLTEPERLPVVTVRGKAVRAGGTPPPGETGISLTGEDGRESIAIAIRPKADGSFQFQYCKGLRFFINAYAYHDPTETVHTTETQSAVAAGETELLLMLTEQPRPAPGATERVSNPTTP